MRPVFFKLTLWNDPQEWDVCPIFRDACRAANRQGDDNGRAGEERARCGTGASEGDGQEEEAQGRRPKEQRD
jgi:hypothetical protein